MAGKRLNAACFLASAMEARMFWSCCVMPSSRRLSASALFGGFVGDATADAASVGDIAV